MSDGQLEYYLTNSFEFKAVSLLKLQFYMYAYSIYKSLPEQNRRWRVICV